jgi:hypothetical protein
VPAALPDVAAGARFVAGARLRGDGAAAEGTSDALPPAVVAPVAPVASGAVRGAGGATSPPDAVVSVMVSPEGSARWHRRALGLPGQQYAR